jgi:hypothetical protein
MILVADCWALVALATCDALSFLDQLFGTVVVPAAVYREAVIGNKPQAEQLRVYLQGRRSSPGRISGSSPGACWRPIRAIICSAMRSAWARPSRQGWRFGRSGSVAAPRASASLRRPR